MPRHHQQPKRFTFDIPSPVHHHQQQHQSHNYNNYTQTKTPYQSPQFPFNDYDDELQYSMEQYSPFPSPLETSPLSSNKQLSENPRFSPSSENNSLQKSLLTFHSINSSNKTFNNNDNIYNYGSISHDRVNSAVGINNQLNNNQSHRRMFSDPLSERRNFQLPPLIIPNDLNIEELHNPIAVIDETYDNLSLLKEPEPLIENNENAIAFDFITEWMTRTTINIQSPQNYYSTIIEQKLTATVNNKKDNKKNKNLLEINNSQQSSNNNKNKKLKMNGPTTMNDRRHSLGIWRQWFK